MTRMRRDGGTESIRWYLRNATRSLHDQADQLGAGFALTEPRDYRRFLRAHARALPGLEAACTAQGVASFIADWPRRLRVPALQADLARLGEAMPPAEPAALAGPVAALGAAYVLEGSRLGNAMLLRGIQDRAGPVILQASAYLSHKPGASAWAEFLAMLDQALPDPALWPEAAGGASAAFTVFLAALRRETLSEPVVNA